MTAGLWLPDALYLPADRQNRLTHIGVGHLIHVHGLHHLGDAQASDGVLQTAQGVDAADADKQRVLRQEAGNIPLERTFRQAGPLFCGVAGDMNIGAAASTTRHIPAGEPAVFPVWLVRVIQADL